jgi:hypothetical protein
MKHDEFVKEVQERGHMGSREEAESAIRATLQTLAERLKGEEAEHLASQLPPGVAEHLRHERAGWASPSTSRNFSTGSTSATKSQTSRVLSTMPGLWSRCSRKQRPRARWTTSARSCPLSMPRFSKQAAKGRWTPEHWR